MFRSDAEDLASEILHAYKANEKYDTIVTRVQDFLIDRDTELQGLRTLGKTVRHLMADRLGDVYFICGQGGSVDNNGLPESLCICPAYGVDWFQVYERTDVTNGVEW